MKIISQDQNQLVAKNGMVGAVVSGIIITLIGLGVAGAFLVGHQTTGAFIGLVAIVIGALILLTARARTLSIDKGAGSMTLNVKSLFGSKDYPYSTSDAVKIQLVTSYQQEYVSNGSRMGGHEETEQKTQLLLVLKDGTTIDLADAQRNMSSFGIFGSVPNQGVGQQIATFLGIPFEQAGPPSLGQVVQGVESMLKGTGAPSFLPGQPQAPAAPAAQPQPPSQPAEPESQDQQGL